MTASQHPHPSRPHANPTGLNRIQRLDHQSNLKKMKPAQNLIVAAFIAAWAGCSSTDLYLEVEGPFIAESIGVEATDLKFITNGDIVETASPNDTDGEQFPMEAAPHQYSVYTKGVIAVSEERIFWAHEGVEHAEFEDFLSVLLADIQAIQRIPDNALLVRTKTQDIILRPHSWTKFAGDETRLNMLRTALVDQGVKVVFTMEEVLPATKPRERERHEDIFPGDTSSPTPPEYDRFAASKDETGRR